MLNTVLPESTYHVILNFVTKRGSCYLLRVTLQPFGQAHEFMIWPSQFGDLVDALVGQHHPETGIANAQLLLDVECRQRKDGSGPYNRIIAFRRPPNLTPMKSDVRLPVVRTDFIGFDDAADHSTHITKEKDHEHDHQAE